VSGSSKTLLYKNASESLAERIRFINIFPLTFREFVKFSDSGLNTDINFISAIFAKSIDEIKKFYYNLIPKKEKIIYLFGEYLKIRGFPE